VHRLFPEPRFCILTFDQFEVRIPASIPKNARLRFGVGFKQNATRFSYIGQIWVHDARGEKHALFSRTLPLTERFDDQHWSDEQIDLSSFAGQSVEIVFTCKALGPLISSPLVPDYRSGLAADCDASFRRETCESPDSFTMLRRQSNPNTPNKAYAFVVLV
jgi:hypothetical protein